jgi:hypothetical protein
MHDSNKTGSIVCEVTGIRVGAHIAPIARSHIENADIVFYFLLFDGNVIN